MLFLREKFTLKAILSAESVKYSFSLSVFNSFVQQAAATKKPIVTQRNKLCEKLFTCLLFACPYGWLLALLTDMRKLNLE